MTLAAARLESSDSRTKMATVKFVKTLASYAPNFLLSGRKKGLKRVGRMKKAMV